MQVYWTTLWLQTQIVTVDSDWNFLWVTDLTCFDMLNIIKHEHTQFQMLFYLFCIVQYMYYSIVFDTWLTLVSDHGGIWEKNSWLNKKQHIFGKLKVSLDIEGLQVLTLVYSCFTNKSFCQLPVCGCLGQVCQSLELNSKLLLKIERWTGCLWSSRH